MTSRERVLAAFQHCQPDRVPLWCGLTDGFLRKATTALGVDEEGLRRLLGDDFRRVQVMAPVERVPAALEEPFRSVFGVEYHGAGLGLPTSHPLAHATLADIEAYPWPDPDAVDISGLSEAARAWGGEYAILGGAWSSFWHDAIDLFGMENLAIALYLGPDLVDAAMQRIVGYYLALNRRIFEASAADIDIFFIGNDFGSQAGPLVSPEHFRRFILRHLKALIDLGHEYELPVQLHCCGGVRELLPAMVEVGLDGIHAVQPDCVGMNLRELKAAFGDRLVFNGAIDSHRVLTGGTPDLVREAVREVLAIMAPGGGYIAGASIDAILEETPLENVIAMAETVREAGVYR